MQPAVEYNVNTKQNFISLSLLVSLGFFTGLASASLSDCKGALSGGPFSDREKSAFVVMKRRQPSQLVVKQQILRTLSRDTKVLLLDENSEFQWWPKRNQICLKSPADSVWVRDYLPVALLNERGQPELVSFEYATKEQHSELSNERIAAILLGHGEPPKPYPRSHQVAKTIADFLGWPLTVSDVVLQGGHLIIADDGTLFVSDSVQSLNLKRNVEADLLELLRSRRLVWLPRIFGEPTGHIDVYSLYLGGKQFLLQKLSRSGFWNEYVEKAATILQRLGYEVEYLESPDEKHLYVNSLIIGQTVYMPVYGPVNFWGKISLDVTDKRAKAKFERLGLQVIAVPAAELLGKMGAVRCMTKTYPAL